MSALDEDDEFEEIPVDLTTFITSPDYMNQPHLSDHQFRYVEMASNIYRPETNRKVFDSVTADRMNNSQVNELCLLWGKGAGKNMSTTLVFARIAYLLLCLKNPATYYNKPPGDSIDMLNVAVNSDQALNTFFNPFKKKIQASPWFQGKYDANKSGTIKFDKNITCYSGHSEREAWEGYNFIVVVLDEIAAFKTEAEVANSNSDRVNSARALYDMYDASVASRFPDAGKLILISFSRFKGDFIWTRYHEVVAEKIDHHKSHTFKIHKDGPDTEDNQFTINWIEDEIVSYLEDGVYAHKAPSWVINPTKNIEMYRKSFYKNVVDALTRFAGMPPDAVDAFFKDRKRVEQAFAKVREPITPDGRFADSFMPEAQTNYYVHVDLAQKSDRAAVAMSHVSDWIEVSKDTPWETAVPKITIDVVKWWTPKPDQNVEFSDVREFILSLRRRGFNLAVVSFDRWAGSVGLQNELVRAGIEVETLSVQKDEYNELSLLISEGRLDGYNVPLLIDELLGLRVRPGGKVDHTRQGTNDLADATCGAAFLAAKYEEYAGQDTISVEFMDDMYKPDYEATIEEAKQRNAIVPPGPRQPAPEEIEDWLDRMSTL